MAHDGQGAMAFSEARLVVVEDDAAEGPVQSVLQWRRTA